MTQHRIDKEVSNSEQKRSPKWLFWPASFAVFCVTFAVAFPTAVEYGFGSLLLVVCIALAVFYGIFGLKFLIRIVGSGCRSWTVNISKVRAYDDLVVELTKWKAAAGEATARANDAEVRLATWDRSNLEEGRRRLTAEIAARETETLFGPIEWAEDGEALVCGAVWSGEMPMVDARYILRTKMMKRTKAVLAVQSIREDRTVIFSVESLVSVKYRSNLIDSTQSGKPSADDIEIVPRGEDQNLGKEALWPEN